MLKRMRTKKTDEANLVYVFLISFAAAIGGFLFGYDLNIICGAQQYLKVAFSLNPQAFGFANSSAMLGCLAGPVLGAWLCDRLGRKRTLIAAAVLFGVSAIGTALPRTIVEFNIFRIVGGVGVGLASVASPMYIAEIAPKNLRGRLVTMNQLAIVVGAIIAIITSYFIATYVAESIGWRWMFASEVVPIVIFLFFLVQLPETPRWLAQQGRMKEAREVMLHINGRKITELEFGGIEDEIDRENESRRVTLGELLAPGIRKALVLGIALSLMSQWTGWSMVSWYMPTIYRQAGIDNAADAIFWTIIPNVALLLFTIIAIYLIGHVGRRPLYLACSLAMAVTMSLLGMVFIAQCQGWPVVLILSLCAAPHTIGLGTLYWLIISEIFPTRIRAKAMSLCTVCMWLASFLIASIAPTLFEWSTDQFGVPSAVFFLFAGVSVVSFIVLLKILPETKGKTLEEIGRFWANG